ncbi:hypothetical protein AOLI_G00175940 [Acnodon oligacanthus]
MKQHERPNNPACGKNEWTHHQTSGAYVTGFYSSGGGIRHTDGNSFERFPRCQQCHCDLAPARLHVIHELISRQRQLHVVFYSSSSAHYFAERTDKDLSRAARSGA